MTQALSPGPEPGQPLELRWDEVLQQHPLPHYVYDPQTLDILAVNEAACLRYGYSATEFLRLNRERLLFPGQVQLLRDFLAGLPATAQVQPQPVWHECTHDGHELFSDIRGRAVWWRGRRARLSVVVDAGSRLRSAADAENARDLLVVAGRLAQVGSWWADRDRRTVFASDLVCDLHEVPHGTQLPMQSVASRYPGEGAAQLDAAVRACFREGVPFDLELPLVTERGNHRWVRTVAEAVRDHTGRIVMLRGAQQDITAQVQVRLELAASRERLQALLKALPDLCLVMDAEGRYLEVNDPSHASLAGPWQHRVGRPITDVLEPAFSAQVMHHMTEAHRTGQLQTFHADRPVASGQVRRFESRYVPLEGGRTLALVRDVTETHQLEQRFRNMADGTPIGIFTTDAQGLCDYTNPAWQALFGLSAEESLGTGWARTLLPEDYSAVHAGWQHSVATREPFEMEFRVHPPGGPVRRMWAQARPVLHPDGSVRGHVGAVVDITQAHELAEARQAQAVAEESGRRQRAFLSRVSHELRTPLNAILGFGGLLQHDMAGHDARHEGYVRHVMDAGRHMLSLVDDLLQLQRIEQGRLDPQFASVDLDALLAGCGRMLAPMADEQGVSLTVLPAPGLTVRSDERGVKQMLLNLGSNAIKYGGRGCRLSLSAQAEPGAVVLTVSDTGRGITPEQLQRLFQPFERLGQEAHHVGGSGLGLVISRQMAQALGGQLDLRSRPGEGTQAVLRLPASGLAGRSVP
jgi:PAS domain S-box-containing protein